MEKNKKAKVIVAIICSVVLVATIILTSVLLLTRKKFNMTPTNEILYNHHEEMHVVNMGNNLSVVNDSTPTYYSNGTVLVKNNDGKTGIYSYEENELIVPTIHSSIEGSEYLPLTSVELNKTPINLHNIDIQNTDPSDFGTGQYIFKSGNRVSGKIQFYDDEGDKLNVTEIDSTTGKTYSYIMQKKMSVEKKRKDRIKISTRNKFDAVKIEIKDINYESGISRYGFTYEIWSLTDTNDNRYTNIYYVNDGNRELIQTIDNPVGNDTNLINSTYTYPVILQNGDLRIISASSDIVAQPNGTILSAFDELTIYTDELEVKKSITLENPENMVSSFILGNYLYSQFITPSTEDDSDFSIVDSSDGSVMYYDLETYRLNLKNGKYKSIKFKYLIEEVNASFNDEVATLNVRPINNNKLDDMQTLLVNEKLKTKEISYEIDSISKINDDRYLVENNNGLYIIDKDYDLVTYLGRDYSSYFTTKESIIIEKNNQYFITSLDGVVVKTYKNTEIKNIYHEKYYMVETVTERNGAKFREYYLERLGLRNSNPIHAINLTNTAYSYKGVNYIAYNNTILEDGISIITRVRINGNKFSYDFYNYDGDLLLTIDDFTSDNRTLIHHGYSDDEGHVLYISTNVGGVGYTIYVDR